MTALAAAGYAWGIGSVNLEPFYGAAARSMSQSWHNFLFGAFDPWGTVTVDKLPGALWVRALSLRLFGFHLWAIAVPQVVEGAMTVLVLYRAVSRVAGAGAGLAAALVPDIFATGHEFLPVGGFAGEVPTPSLPQLIHYVDTGRVVAATAAVAPRSRNPDMIWIIEHCTKRTTGNTYYTFEGTTMQRYVCPRAEGTRASR